MQMWLQVPQRVSKRNRSNLLRPACSRYEETSRTRSNSSDWVAKTIPSHLWKCLLSTKQTLLHRVHRRNILQNCVRVIPGLKGRPSMNKISMLEIFREPGWNLMRAHFLRNSSSKSMSASRNCTSQSMTGLRWQVQTDEHVLVSSKDWATFLYSQDKWA